MGVRCVCFICMFYITFYAYYFSYWMLHGYFVSVILQILGQEQIRRKERKLANRWYQVNNRDAKPEIWCRVGKSQQSFHIKSEISQKSDTDMDQEFGHPAVYFWPSSRGLVNGNANSEVNTSQKVERQYNKKFGQPAELWWCLWIEFSQKFV